MKPITFFTVCGGGEEYEFLLGAIEHHARIGRHLVLDVSDVSQEQREFRGLPDSVLWFRDREGKYMSGDWKTFKFATALEDARKLALTNFPDTHFLVHLDCDEYFDPEILVPLLSRNERPPIETPRTFTFPTIHWKDGHALQFGASELHMRAWDVRADVRVKLNDAWRASEKYNGNPEHHPYFYAHAPHSAILVRMPVHYHLHYALGKKKFYTETAETTIDGWPHGVPVANPCPWPDPLQLWAETGELPSKRFFQCDDSPD